MEHTTLSMRGKFHGVFSLVLIFAAVGIALIYTLNLSGAPGVVYLALIIIAIPVVLYSYCAKCTCRDGACSHVFLGKLTRLLPERKQGPYTLMDYSWTALVLIVLFGFPNFLLWQNKLLFVAYWTLLLVGLAEIIFLVCRACRNDNCPMRAISELQTHADDN